MAKFKKIPCARCGKIFQKKFSASKYCSDPCRRYPMLYTGHYVYAWYDGEQLLYVGCGKLGRAEACHLADYPELELHKLDAQKRGAFRVEYLVTGLDKEVAHQVELVFVKHLKPTYNTFGA